MKLSLYAVSLGVLLLAGRTVSAGETHRQVSGVYPHLAMYNAHGECGTGAVVPWADRLWVITYAPHESKGSTDKLYEIDRQLNQVIRPESVGGTPAGRMIHRESGQLFIGPYAIDQEGSVRVIPPDAMPGRLTGVARSQEEPSSKVRYATMEEGFYEVDVRSLEVTTLHPDANRLGYGAHRGPLLPGHHGKGLYAGQGRLIYSNNGEFSKLAQREANITSGVLAERDDKTGEWRVIRRNQFTEVSGPGGIEGSSDPANDPIWSIGWDHRSLILMLLDDGEWSAYRLPKGSHSYDGAHGWNTEWPRIRAIGEEDLLMTMHGLFWRFPLSFSREASGGLAPRSAYLKVVGDFCRWGDRLVLGCDDTAKNEFLNRRRAKGPLGAPGVSHSNLWFIDPERLDQMGPAVARGAVWQNDPVNANAPSDPFLFDGFDRRGLHLSHKSDETVVFTLEVDRLGNGDWTTLSTLEVEPQGYRHVVFDDQQRGAWLRMTANRDCDMASAVFEMSDADRRDNEADAVFASLLDAASPAESTGVLWVLDQGRRRLGLAAEGVKGVHYELDQDLQLKAVADSPTRQQILKKAPLVEEVLEVDAASVVYTDDEGQRWRLPKGDPAFDNRLHAGRIDREVVTERDLFNCHGTFYELPARNAGGFAKIRPVATHNKAITDYCSYRGLVVLSGVAANAEPSEHVIRSDDGKAALWVGVIDDLWRLGKPRGTGGPWLDTAVQAGMPSDAYLMTGYDKKSYRLEHDSQREVVIEIQIDPTGEGDWRRWSTESIAPGSVSEGEFPTGMQAYWIRAVADADCQATFQLRYE